MKCSLRLLGRRDGEGVRVGGGGWVGGGVEGAGGGGGGRAGGGTWKLLIVETWNILR